MVRDFLAAVFLLFYMEKTKKKQKRVGKQVIGTP